MRELNEVEYSESVAVAAIGDFFKFLTEMYLDEATVVWPPEGGWPTVTAHAFGSLGKSDRVISLLRQLPYMQDFNLPPWERPQCAPEANFCNWKDNAIGNEDFDPAEVHGLKLVTEGFVWKRTPPDIIGLWIGGRDSPLILLDTKYGIVYWPECNDEIRYETSQEQIQDDSDAWATDEEANWRCDAPAWTVTDFFAMLREQFEQLRFLPVNSRQVIASDAGYSDDCRMERMLQEIYREHGWPNLEHYRKEECIQAVEKALEEQYPDFFPY